MWWREDEAPHAHTSLAHLTEDYIPLTLLPGDSEGLIVRLTLHRVCACPSVRRVSSKCLALNGREAHEEEKKKLTR